MKKLFVTTEIKKWQLVEALREATVGNNDFDVREWSIGDAELLRAASDMIFRELREGFEEKLRRHIEAH